MDVKKAGAVVISTGADPYLLVGAQGSLNQSLVFIEGIKKALSFKDAHVTKAVFAAAVAAVYTLPVPASPASGSQLSLFPQGIFVNGPEVDRKVFCNANIGDNESLTQAQWGARIISTFNANTVARTMFTAAYSAGTVTFTEVTPGSGNTMAVQSSVSSMVLTQTAVSKAKVGLDYNDIVAMQAKGGSDFEVNVLGTLNTADQFDVYTITVQNNSIMKPFGFRENKPEQYIIAVEEQFDVTSNGTNFPSRLEQLYKFDATNWDPDYGTGEFSDANVEADDDTFTKTAHGLVTGDLVLCTQKTNGTGLNVGQVYTVVKVSANTFTLTYGGVAVAITADGTNIGFKKVTQHALPEGVYTTDNANSLAAILLSPSLSV